MTETEFWHIIEASRSGMSATMPDGNLARQHGLLRDALAATRELRTGGFSNQNGSITPSHLPKVSILWP